MTDYAYLREPIGGAVAAGVIRRTADGAILREDPDGGDWRAYLAWAAAGGVPDPAPDLPAPGVPDGPTLSDWRVALTLWDRLDDVSAKVAALVASSDPAQAKLGKIARERLEYANTVSRAQLMALKDALGFSEAEIDESLWRAAQVAKGDLSGVWPLPAKSA